MEDRVAHRISCTLVEVPDMADSLAAPGAFQDLVPWADPYIVEIVRKLQRSTGGLLEQAWPDSDLWAELPPTLVEPDEETSVARHHATAIGSAAVNKL